MMKSCENSHDRHLLSLPQRMTAVVLLMVCCGCPPKPPSQEQQRQAVTSRWIAVESKATDHEGESCLDQDDLNAIINGVPTISTAVVETVRTEMIESDDARAEAKVCGTGPEYFRLLEEMAKVKVQQGRFLASIDSEKRANNAVLSDRIAKKLFPDGNPLGRTVALKGLKLTVVGVVSDGAQWGADVKRDAYVPLHLFGNESDPNAPFPCDRFRFRVDSLDQVEGTEAIIENILQRRPKD